MNYWQQQHETPLYPDVIWSRPTTKRGAGKLLLIGGNEHGFAHVASAYAAAENSGVGTTRIIVPDSLSKLTKNVPNIEYAPSNPSGSFARSALATFIEAAEWSDGVLLSGDIGKNSETILLIEDFIMRYKNLLCIDEYALDSVVMSASMLLDGQNRIVVWNLAQLRQAVIELGLTSAVISDIGKSQLAEILHELSSKYRATIALKHRGTWIANEGKVTSSDHLVPSASLAVWALQQPAKRYEALVSAAAIDE